MSEPHEPRVTAARSGLPLDSQTRKRVKLDSACPIATSGRIRGNPSISDPTKRLNPAGAAVLANLMVGYRLDSTFHALADPTRRRILARLAEGEKSVAELTRGLAMSGTGAAKHLAVLAAAGLIRRRRDGRHSLCALDADPIAEAALWLRRWQRFESKRVIGIRRLFDAAEGTVGRAPPPPPEPA